MFYDVLTMSEEPSWFPFVGAYLRSFSSHFWEIHVWLVSWYIFLYGKIYNKYICGIVPWHAYYPIYLHFKYFVKLLRNIFVALYLGTHIYPHFLFEIVYCMVKKYFCGVVPWYAYYPPGVTIKWRLQAYIVGPAHTQHFTANTGFYGRILKTQRFSKSWTEVLHASTFCSGCIVMSCL